MLYIICLGYFSISFLYFFFTRLLSSSLYSFFLVNSPPIPLSPLATRTLKLLNSDPSAPTVPYPVTARARRFLTKAIFPELFQLQCQIPVLAPDDVCADARFPCQIRAVSEHQPPHTQLRTLERLQPQMQVAGSLIQLQSPPGMLLVRNIAP